MLRMLERFSDQPKRRFLAQERHRRDLQATEQEVLSVDADRMSKKASTKGYNQNSPTEQAGMTLKAVLKFATPNQFLNFIYFILRYWAKTCQKSMIIYLLKIIPVANPDIFILTPAFQTGIIVWNFFMF